MSCRKCGCKSFFWNPVSAFQKGVSGSSLSATVPGPRGSSISAAAGTLPTQDNRSSQTAYRNCMCGHHQNYHG